MTSTPVIPIRYQQLVLFPCCTGSGETHPNIIHIFGRLSSDSIEVEETLKEVCHNTRAHPLWKSNILSDKLYSYLPHIDFIPIDYRKTMYQHWTRILPNTENTWEEVCQSLENIFRTIKYSREEEVVCVSWMYNVIFYTQHVARSYHEFIQDWCDYIRLECPCSSFITRIIAVHKKDYQLYYQCDVSDNEMKYITYDQWLLKEKDNPRKHTFSRWKEFRECIITRSYHHIKSHSCICTEDDVLYMVTLPLLYNMLNDSYRFITQLFIDDSIHDKVIQMVQEWLSQFGCILCRSYESNHVPTMINYDGNRTIHVTSIHTHIRYSINNDSTTINSILYPTLENIKNVMNVIPNFMLDGQSEF